MGWNSTDLEGDSEWLYRRAGVDCAAPAPPIWLAAQLLGAGCVLAVPALRQPGGACLARVSGVARIYYRERLPPERRNFAVAHELAHWCLRDRAGEDVEQACDYLAAALIAPRRAFLKAVQKHGARFTRLAKAFATTESLVALRFGETTLEPLALVAPLSVRVRGSAYSWPSQSALRAIAAAPKPRLRKAQLRDDARRLVLRA